MIEATRILQQAPTPAQAQAMSAAVMALARHRAIKAVKREIRDRGLKPQYMALREIVVAADEYLPHHPELIAEAKETVLRWHAEGMFGKRGGIRGLICKGFCCANVMIEMESEYDIGYARVSTDGQTLDAQHAALITAGAERVFAEKVSGAVLERKALVRALAALGSGDVLLVTRLDRLARSTRDLLNVIDTIAKAGAGFRLLADAWADTTTPHGRLMLTVLSGLAEFERELIRARTDEGRKRAQARGVRFGRKLKLTAHQRAEAIARRDAGELLAEIGRSYNVSHSTISRLRDDSDGVISDSDSVISDSDSVISNGTVQRIKRETVSP